MEKKIVYIATPYSHDDNYVKEQRFLTVSKIAGVLMAQGNIVFSPISMCHPIAKIAELPENWEYWKELDTEYLKVCSKVIVVQAEGWETSTGVQGEIAIAEELGIPIEYLRPESILEM